MPSKIILYDEPLVPEIDICGLAAFAERTLHVAAEVRGPLLADLRTTRSGTWRRSR